MANKLLLIIFLFTIQLSYPQNKTFNNKGSGQQNNNTGSGSQKIYNKTTVTVNKRVDQENHYNDPTGAHLYATDFSVSDFDSTHEIHMMAFENPDSLPVYHIDISVQLESSFDTAYCVIPGFTDKPFNPTNKKTLVRDKLATISSDKTTYRFRAGYFAPNTKLIIYFVSNKKTKGKKINISGAGKLF